jgi:phage terminase Nu1 subunit (DNA packaging protein)
MTTARKRRGLLKRAELAKRLGKHPQTISDWTAAGCPVARRGRTGSPILYSERDVRAWLAAREEEARAPDGPLDPIQEKAARDHWQAELARQTHEIRHKTLLPAADVERAWAAEVAAVRAKLLALPTTYSDRIYRASTLDGLAGVEKTVQAAVYDVLRQLAGALPKEGAA